MRPRDTDYYLATEQDILEILANFSIEEKLGWPVIIARREGKIVGYLATKDNDEAVIAGPLEVALKQKSIVGMRLVEIYEKVLSMMGIHSYLFCVDGENNQKWSEQVQDLGVYTKIAEESGLVWYRRSLA